MANGVARNSYWSCYKRMARIADHPLRIARLKAGLSQLELAKRAGVQRSAISAIEDGRTKKPTERLLGVVAPLLDMEIAELENDIQVWLNKPLEPPVKPSAVNLMAIPPYVLGQYYKSFKQWREEIAPTPTALASMLRLNPATVRDYENGKMERLPDTLAAALFSAFEKHGFSGEYLAALEALPRS